MRGQSDEDRVTRTERKSGEEKRNGRLVGASETSGELAEWRRLQQQNFSMRACRKRKSGLSATERAVGKNARTAFAKGKRYRVICTDHQIVRWERVKVSESCTLTREGGMRAEIWGGKGGLHSEGRQVQGRERGKQKGPT